MIDDDEFPDIILTFEKPRRVKSEKPVIPSGKQPSRVAVRRIILEYYRNNPDMKPEPEEYEVYLDTDERVSMGNMPNFFSKDNGAISPVNCGHRKRPIIY